MQPNALARCAGAAFGALAMAAVPAQTARAPDYLEQLTRANVTQEFVAFSELALLIGRSEANPEDAVRFAARVYELDQADAVQLVAVAREADEEMKAAAESDGLDARTICEADIKSAQEYAAWWTRLAEENDKRYSAMVQFVSSRVDPSVWTRVVQRVQAEWDRRETFGARTNYQKLVESEDYRVLLSRLCG
jgi:hypothetical protein